MGGALITAIAIAAMSATAVGAASANEFAHGSRRPRLREVSSANQTWGGYAMIGAAPYTSISGSWNIPTMNCARGSGDASPWIGIDGWATNTVEQIGVDLDCSASGVASYKTWVEMFPKNSVYFAETVKAGDTLKASVSLSGSTWTLSESDPMQGWTKTFHYAKPAADKLASAEAIVEDIGGGVPKLDDFGTVTFSNLVVNGEPFTSVGTAHVTTMQRKKTLLSSESALATESFSITWLHR